jgi:hypothetical protein
LIFIGIFFLIIFPIFSIKTPAQLNKSKFTTIQFHLPDLGDKDAPGDTEGAGRRGKCPQSHTPLTALVPSNKKSEYLTNVWGLTIQKSPTLWFYIPYSSRDVSEGTLVIWDETDVDRRKHQQIYQGNFFLHHTPGIIHLSLPPSVRLENDRKYHWYLSIPINCGSENHPIGVNGWVWIDSKKLNELLPILSANLSKPEQAIILSQHGIWQDALTLVAQISEPVWWKQLLTDIKLDSLTSEKIVPCCILNDSD